MKTLTAFAAFIALTLASNPAQVQLENGAILQGKVVGNYASFTGIPYAEAPIGKLRFKDPVAKKSWPTKDVFDATQPTTKCAQLAIDPATTKQNPEAEMVGSEDCLMLNVYLPLEKSSENLPVMVWIHGGAFVTGDSSPDSYAPDLLMASPNPVILVTVNYRLGVLGFLTLGDDVIPGNLGLKDQNMALQWVKSNIAQFGGNAEKVTLFGESAGASAVTAHLLSPWSKGLFHRAIIQSGRLIDLKGLIPSIHPPEYYARFLLEDLDPEDDLDQLNSLQQLQILQKVPVEDLVRRNALFEEFKNTLIPWVPIIDKFSSNPFMPEDPQLLLNEGNYNQVPIILGGNEDEGCINIVQFLLEPELFKSVHENFETKGPKMLLGISDEDVTEEDSATAQLIKNEYLDGLHTNFTFDNWQRISKMFSDVNYLVPKDLLARSLVEKSHQPVFYYRLKYKNQGQTRSQQSLKNFDLGVCHADELHLLFNDQKSLKSDQKMSQKLIDLWTSFADKGVPNDAQWQALTKDNHQWAVLKGNGQPIKMAWDEDFEQKVEFLRSMFEVLIGYRNMNFEDHPAVKEMLNRPAADEPIDFPEVNGAEGIYQPPEMDSKIHEEL